MIADLRQQRDRTSLVAELESAGATIKGNSVCCPFHDDSSPSGGIYQGEDQVWRYCCQAASCGFSGDIFDVRAKHTGKSVGDILKEAQGEKPTSQKPAKVYPTLDDAKKSIPGEIQGEYKYIHPETGKVELVVYRYRQDRKKHYRQISPVAGGYVAKAPKKPWPLYCRKRVSESEIIVVVEGERCANVLGKYGFTASTSPCGAGKAAHADWTPLAGKTVYLWGDNDVPGVNHMREVRQLLEKLDDKPTVLWVAPGDMDLPKGGDIVDFVREVRVFGEDKIIPELNNVLSKAKPCSVAAEVSDLIEDVISGRREAIEWPWRALGKLTQALIPQAVCVLCGDPGATKSFFLLESLAEWYGRGIKIAAFMLEEDCRFHLMRALAQRENNSDLCTLTWIKENPEEARTAYQRNKKFLDGFGHCIDEAPAKQATLDDVVAWILRKAQAGVRIIAVDPVTAATATAQPWVSDSKFVANVKVIVRKYETSLILITHPKKGRTGFGLDDLSGGASYQRLAQTILWIQYHKKKELHRIKTDCGTDQVEINRTLHICKARNGKGTGLRLGYIFNGDSFRMAEQGIIVSER